MKNGLTAGALGALAVSAALIAAPQSAKAQSLSIGFGGPSYGYAEAPYDVEVGSYGVTTSDSVYGAYPAYPGYPYRGSRVVTTYPATGFYGDAYEAPRPLVRQRIVTRRPAYAYPADPYATASEVRGGYRTVIVSRNPVRRAAVDAYGRIVRYY